MTFRSRLRLAFVAIVLVPMLAFAFVVRREVGERLTAQYEQRVTSLVAVIEEDLAHESDAIAATLAGLRDALFDDNRFRRSALPGPDSERRYLIDIGSGSIYREDRPRHATASLGPCPRQLRPARRIARQISRRGHPS